MLECGGPQVLNRGPDNIGDHCYYLHPHYQLLGSYKALYIIKDKHKEREHHEDVPGHVEDNKVFVKGYQVIQKTVDHVASAHGNKILRNQVHYKICDPPQQKQQMSVFFTCYIVWS